MEAASKLLSEIREALGKAFFFTGLLPAGVVLLGWSWFQAPDQSLAAIVESYVAGIDPHNATAGLVVLFAVAFGFFALRAPIVWFFDTLPLPALLRRRWLNRKFVRRAELERRQKELRTAYQALKWATGGYEIGWVQDSLPEEKATEVARKSRAGYDALHAMTQDGKSHGGFSGRPDHVTTGLMSLHVFQARSKKGTQPELSPDAASSTRSLESEIHRWKQLTRSPKVRALLDDLAEDTYRRWIEAYTRSRRFPRRRWLQPTILGNMRAALDEYGHSRYGIDTGALWSRTWPILSEEEKGEIEERRLWIEASLNLCASLALLSLLVAVAVVVQVGDAVLADAARPSWWVVFFLALPALFSAGAYRSGLFHYQGLVSRIQTLIDHKRLRVIRSLGYELPRTVKDELALFKELRGFFNQGSARDRWRRLVAPE